MCKTVMTYSLTAITVFIIVEASKIINHLFTRLWVGQPGNSFDSLHRQIFFSPSQRLGCLGAIPLTCPLVTQDFSAFKGPGREADHFPGSVVLKLQWYVEIPFILPHISKSWCLKEQLRLEVTYSWKDKKKSILHYRVAVHSSRDKGANWL